MKHRIQFLTSRHQIILLGFEWWYFLVIIILLFLAPFALIMGADTGSAQAIQGWGKW